MVKPRTTRAPSAPAAAAAAPAPAAPSAPAPATSPLALQPATVAAARNMGTRAKPAQLAHVHLPNGGKVTFANGQYISIPNNAAYIYVGPFTQRKGIWAAVHNTATRLGKGQQPFTALQWLNGIIANPAFAACKGKYVAALLQQPIGSALHTAALGWALTLVAPYNSTSSQYKCCKPAPAMPA